MIENYSHDWHFERLKEWNDSRGQFGLEQYMLPDLGFVWNDRAIAFLVTTNSKVAWIANWTFDPSLRAWERDEATAELLSKIESVSRDLGFRFLQTLGRSGKRLADRLRANDFLEAPGEFIFFVKDLEQGA